MTSPATTSTVPATPRRLRTRAAAAVLLAAGLAAYANGFTDRFVGLDARESIRDNPHIRRLWPITDAMSFPLLASTKAADAGSKGGTVVRRPILSLSFALNYVLLGEDPDGFHAVNIAIHLCAALLLFGVLRRTLARWSLGDAADWIALVTALLWVVHPVHVESVTYVVQRAESLMGMFFLLTVYAAIRSFEAARPLPWQALAVTACALGMGTKEVAAVAPVFVLLYDATLTPPSGSGGVSRMTLAPAVAAALRRRPLFYAALFATWAILAAMMLVTLADVSSDFTEGRNLEYALAQPAVVLHYLRASLWPHPLHLHVNTLLYDKLPVAKIVLPALALALPLGLTAYGLWRRRWYGLVGAWFFLILAPSSSVVAVSDVVQDHRIYLSLAAVLLVVVLGARELLVRAGPSAARAAAATAVVAATLMLAALTHARNRDFHSEFDMLHPADLHEAFLILGNHYTLGGGDPGVARAEAHSMLETSAPGEPDFTYAHWLLGLLADEAGAFGDAAEHFALAAQSDPRFARATIKHGEALLQAGRTAEAHAAFARAAASDATSADVHVGLGRALLSLGDARAAAEAFARAVALEPNLAAAHNNLGYALEVLGDTDRARTEYQAALALDPGMVVASTNLARLLAAAGDTAAAARIYDTLIAGDPNELAAYEGAADACEKAGDWACAEKHLREAIRIEPAEAALAGRLGAVLEKRGESAQARAAYERALALNAGHGGARTALATLLAREGRFAEAAQHFEKVLADDPDNVDAHANLGATYAAQGETAKAAQHFEAALRLAPDRRAVNFNLGMLFETRGDLETARGYYERELHIDPTFAAARDGLDRVRRELSSAN